MSTWTDEKHESARKWVNAEGARDTWVEERGDEFLADALDAIERLRALTTITDDMVERAAREMAGLEPGESWPSNIELGGSLTGTRDDEHRAAWHEEARAALEAALSPKEKEA